MNTYFNKFARIMARNLFVFGVVCMVSVADSESPRHYSVRDFGAVGDGIHMDTAAIQKAVDAAENGGVVEFPAGTYLSGTILLKSGVTLHLDFGATLLGSTDLADFPVLDCPYRSYTDKYTQRALLWGYGLHDIVLTGHGTISGQGATFEGKPYLERPFIIRFVQCSNVRVEDLSLRDAPMWMQHYLACDGVYVRGIQVWNHCNKNNDMIDIDGCRDVRISDCISDTDDDGLTLKSTSDRACENVVIANCILASHCNALKMGTESNGGFKNIAISNCAIRQSADDQPIAGRREGISGISLEIVDGGTLDQVVVSNVTIDGVLVPLFLRLGDRARPFKPDMPKPGVGRFRNVVLSNIVAKGASKLGCSITGLPEHPIENVTLDNIRIEYAGGGTLEDAGRAVDELPDKYPEAFMFGTLPAYGFYCRHVDGLTLRNAGVSVASEDRRPALVCDDVTRLHIEQFDGTCAESSPGLMQFRNVRHALVTGCSPSQHVPVLLNAQSACSSISLIGNDLSHVAKAVVADPGTPRRAVKSKGNMRDR
ncbi:MAG: glycoside hydrolase family 28 protein [Candidatus Hydrogenedentes bacterium]|nr:glycoside hydrolase family 28 protein [Candidatus Hydrogenedentota bacterium]